ncbi:MAG: ABC transporter substrate-binding protein, partial [Pseudolabrys sp.]
MSRVRWHFRRAVALTAVLFLGLSASHVSAQAPEKKDIKVMMDWIIQGTHAPFFVAQQKGYYKDAGLNVQIDAGKGATNVA